MDYEQYYLRLNKDKEFYLSNKNMFGYASKPYDKAHAWLSGVVIHGEYYKMILFYSYNGNDWLNDMCKVVERHVFDESYKEELDLFDKIVEHYCHKHVNIKYKKDSPQKGNSQKVNDMFQEYKAQTPVPPTSRNSSHTDQLHHNDSRGYDDHIDRSTDLHKDYGRDYDDHNDQRRNIHGDWIGWNEQHDDKYDYYNDFIHTDTKHSDSYDDYIDHKHSDTAHDDSGKHTDSGNK